MKKILILMSLVVMLPDLAYAQKINFCKALSDNQTYKKDTSYKKLIEGEKGWIFRTKTDFTTDFKVNNALQNRFERLHKAFQEQDIELVVALLPTRGMMHHEYIDYPDYDAAKAIESYRALVSKLEKTGILVASVDDFSAGQNFFYKRDHHWNSEGAMMMAKKVAAKVKDLPAFKNVNKAEYKTEISGTLNHKGTFSDFVEKTCSTNIPPESVSNYKTFTDNASEQDLFSDAQEEDILLIGTSNSTQTASQANFDGFLREYIGAEIKNLSLTGGGFDSAMLSWLASDQYKNKKPKIVIWEFPVYQNFKGSPFYRQVVPAIYGDCEGSAILSDEMEIEKNKFSLFKDIKNQNIIAKDHYIFLQFSNFNKRKFRLTTEFSDSDKDAFNFRRSKFYESDGTFFLDFEQQDDISISNVTGLLPKDVTGKLTARVCKYPEAIH